MNLNLAELKQGGIVALREKDMFSIWVKTACCNLNSNQLRKIADIADQYARGFILFTSRQIPIIPFVSIKDIHKVKEELGKVELDLDHCGARVRNLNVCYDDKICHKAIVNCISLGEKLERFFSNDLKHKVKIGAAGCSEDCIMSRALNDISFVGVQENGITGYDAHIGGRLGLNPFLGVKIAECISENNCVQLVSNYFDLLRQEGKPGDRSADLVKRIGLDKIILELNKGLSNTRIAPSIDCTKIKEKDTAKIILKIRATCGEVTTGQVRKIAAIADESGYGFVHFSVRGSPEIPGIDRKKVPVIENKLNECGLQLIHSGMDNIQSCFGAYCTESLADPQSLLKKLETKINKLGLNHSNLSFSASGCPNSCGIAHLSDIGFYGVVEPEIILAECNGCELCISACRRKAITIENDKAIINMAQCRHCGQCITVCPTGAIQAKRQGFTVLTGGCSGTNIQLGSKLVEFVSEDEALGVIDDLMLIADKHGTDLVGIIDVYRSNGKSR